MIVVAQIVVMISLGVIAVQDLREYQVWWFLFPIYAIAGGILFADTTYFELYRIVVAINGLILLGFFSALWLYVRLVLKKNFFKEAFGLGDVLLYVALAVSFPTLTFLIFLILMPIFSLILSKVLRPRKKNVIPFAGYVGILLIGIYGAHWLGLYKTLYLF